VQGSRSLGRFWAEAYQSTFAIDDHRVYIVIFDVVKPEISARDDALAVKYAESDCHSVTAVMEIELPTSVTHLLTQ